MKIHQISIKNFRGIRLLDLEFTDPVTVLVGQNGAGKSSILDGIAMMLSEFYIRGHLPPTSHRGQDTGYQGIPFQDVDIYAGQDSAEVDMKIGADDCLARLSMRCELGERINGVRKPECERVYIDDLNRSHPMIVYYPVNRFVAEIPLEIDQPIDFTNPFAIVYADAVATSVDFRAFFLWYRQREDLEQEKIMDQRMAYGLSGLDSGSWPTSLLPGAMSHDSQLVAVRQAIERFTALTDLRVRRNSLRMEVRKQGELLWLDHLSNGEKCLLAMVGDIARRLAILSGDNPNPLHGQGIVLIDEIDLHLHPAWQREIIPKLVQTFPNCQFIVSTHSPQVISDVRPESVFLLRQEEGNVVLTHPKNSYGRSSDQILEDNMGVPSRPQNIKDKLRSIFYLISINDLDTAKDQAAELQEEIGYDPDLLRASTRIRRKEVLGE